LKPKELTIKELKKILSEHNCSIPTGSKKNDLIKLVEEINMSDKAFLEATSDETFEDLFEEETGDLVAEEPSFVKTESPVDKIEDNTPSVGSAEWDSYVMSQFQNNELIDGNPICAGLRRVTELVLGDIVSSGPVQVFPANDENGPGRATVVFKVVIECFDGKMREYSEVADVWHGNTDDLFCAHPVATASTRAEGRALRKALKLRVLAAEELARKDIVEIVKQSVKSANRIDGITNQQIQFMDNFCSRFDINVLNFINMGKETYPSIYEINKDKAAQMIKHLNQYQKPDNEVPDSIKGYDANWRSE
jgi:hypothetical protein